MKLTTITVPREMVLRHYVESQVWGEDSGVGGKRDRCRFRGWISGDTRGGPSSELMVTLVEADKRKAVFLRVRWRSTISK
jgi:16S rRNA G527 N7-methylase RsmG